MMRSSEKGGGGMMVVVVVERWRSRRGKMGGVVAVGLVIMVVAVGEWW